MKIEVELEDNIYNRTQEIFGADVDLSRVISQMFGAILVLLATYPEDYRAVFETRQASPEQRQRIDDAMDHLTSKVLERAKKVKQ